MHEMAITRSILEIIVTAAEREAARRVQTVRLAIGAFSHVEPAAVRFCFELAARGTVAEGAALILDQPAGEAVCPCCDKSFPVISRLEACPQCGARNWRLERGEELKVMSLEVV